MEPIKNDNEEVKNDQPVIGTQEIPLEEEETTEGAEELEPADGPAPAEPKEEGDNSDVEPSAPDVEETTGGAEEELVEEVEELEETSGPQYLGTFLGFNVIRITEVVLEGRPMYKVLINDGNGENEMTVLREEFDDKFVKSS